MSRARPSVSTAVAISEERRLGDRALYGVAATLAGGLALLLAWPQG